MPTFRISLVGDESIQSKIALVRPYNVVQKFVSDPKVKEKLKYKGGGFFQFKVKNLRTGEVLYYDAYFGWNERGKFGYSRIEKVEEREEINAQDQE